MNTFGSKPRRHHLGRRAIEVDAFETRHRVQESIQRYAVALLDFDCALSLLSQMDEYKSAETNPENSQEIKKTDGHGLKGIAALGCAP
jgi:hypothetical protein